MSSNKGGVFNKRNKQNSATQKKSLKEAEEEEEEEARLSSLPDFLILHILSFLETKEVVKTCVLSKRWKFIWTDISEIDLWENRVDYELRKLFVDRVGRMLAMCNGLHLKRFAVYFRYSECFASNINLWVHFVVKNKVKDIVLRCCDPMIWSNLLLNLPQMLYLHSYMTSMEISYCKIDPRGVIEWGSLKSLRIEDVIMSDSVMEKILKGSPVLEVLSLWCVSGLTCFNISSPNLTTLEIRDCELYDDEDFESKPLFEISAPHLLVLSIKEHIRGVRYRLRNVSSLVRAEIRIMGDDEDRDIYASMNTMSYMIELLFSLRSVKDLKLGHWCTEVLSSLELKGTKVPSSPRLCLKLNTLRNEGNFPGILSILKSSPYLETLVIKAKSVPSNEEFITRNQVATYLQDHKLELVMFRLKTIKITGFTTKLLLSETMLMLVELLLKSANVLEKLVIREELGESSLPSDSTCLNKLTMRLLNFRRASPNAVVVVC